MHVGLQNLSPRKPQKSGFSGVAGATESGRLGIRAILAQVKQDLVETKDVQDNPTGTYVWLADQIGHFVLGLLPVQLICWFWHRQPTSGLVALILVSGVMGLIERNGVKADTARAQAGHFPLDTADLAWNAKTTMVYTVIGGAVAAAAFFHGSWLLAVLLLSLWPSLAVAYWWLKRHLSFQQTGAPYLYRLANFKSTFVAQDGHDPVDLVARLANLANRKIRLLDVLLGNPEKGHAQEPEKRHLLITGPLLCGKTSLAAGITTEFAFALGTARFLSPIDLLEALVIPSDPNQKLDFDDGILTWKVRECELVVVDDVDSAVTGIARTDPVGGEVVVDDVNSAVSVTAGPQTTVGLIRPSDFAQALKNATNGNNTPLAWLTDKRSVWVIGDIGGAPIWKTTLAGLMGEPEMALEIIELSRPGPIPSSPSA